MIRFFVNYLACFNLLKSYSNDIFKLFTTKNQKALYTGIKDGTITKIVPYGKEAVVVSSNFKAIDFYKKNSLKYYASSLKTCNRFSVSNLLNDSKFRTLLNDLTVGAEKKIFKGINDIRADEVHLYIAVPKDKLAMFENIEAAIHVLDIKNIGKVKVFVTTIENAVGL